METFHEALKWCRFSVFFLISPKFKFIHEAFFFLSKRLLARLATKSLSFMDVMVGFEAAQVGR